MLSYLVQCTSTVESSICTIRPILNIEGNQGSIRY
jgi:hypothetical protein